MITIYTDGACRGNQSRLNAGGWGFLLQDEGAGTVRECWGHTEHTTNVRMEMLAAIKALEAIQELERCEVVIYSDSNLLIQGMNSWLAGWKAKGWRKSDKKPVLNCDLWRRLDALSAHHEMTWRHVKGHSGNPGNEKADELANRGADGDTGMRNYCLNTS